MNEFPHLHTLESEEEKQSIDDASFVTARENFTVDRSSFLSSDDSFVTVRNFSADQHEISSISSNLDLTMVVNCLSDVGESYAGESEGQLQQCSAQQVHRDKSETEAVGRKKAPNEAVRPRERRLVTPRKYFLDLMARRVSKNTTRNLQSSYKKKLGGIHKSLRIPLRKTSNSRIPPPTIHFKKHLYQRRPLRKLSDQQSQRCVYDDCSTEEVRRLLKCTACYPQVVNSCTSLNNEGKE
ncbi:hypothetical protein ANCCAN_08363 [Ancylostoma caninum]|uniref:Uncharacterized protein n=1 Tax=Ancylostoma caninum TaxID=29170 RepID=A0A368GRI1_ANCCA|nr:hypothetical protein ANCCAN_08363 [Ancylostoma caninum]